MPNATDLLVGFDPTGYTSITGAQLAQLVNSATPTSDRGFVLQTTDSGAGDPDVPNAAGTVAWQRYIWLRVSGTSVTAYLWNDNGSNSNYVNPTTGTVTSLLKWQTVSNSSIAPGQITGTMIAAGTITALNLASGSLPSSYITGGVPADWVSTAQGDGKLIKSDSPIYGAITGTINATVLGDQSVSGDSVALAGQIVDGSVYDKQIADNTLKTKQLLKNSGSTYANDNPFTSTTGAVDPGVNITVPNKSLVGIPASSNYNPSTGSATVPGDLLAVTCDSSGYPTGYATVRRAITTLAEPTVQTSPRVPYVDTGAIVYTFENPQSKKFGLVQQQGFSSVVTSTAITVATSDLSTLVYNTANLQDVTSVTLSVTTDASYHLISVVGSMYQTGTSYGWVYLYKANGGASPIAAIRIANGAGSNCSYGFALNFRASNSGTAAVTYYAKYGGSVNNKVSANGDTASMTVIETL